jgi:hypothetical protein
VKVIDPQAAVDFIKDNAGALAKAKAERVYLEAYSKSLKSILMAQSAGKSMAEQERDAQMHPDYLQHLDGLKAAVEAEERLRWLMVAAQARVEVWRTSSANDRMMDRNTQ